MMKTKTIALALIALAGTVLAQSEAQANYSQQQIQQFVQVHANHFGPIYQKAQQMHAKLDLMHAKAVSINGSQYTSLRSQILVRIKTLKVRIGTYGSYTITTTQQVKLVIPNENTLDNLIDQLEDLCDDLEDLADDNNNDNIENIAEDLKDLTEDLDDLEDNLSNKVDDLKDDWQDLGGAVSYF